MLNPLLKKTTFLVVFLLVFNQLLAQINLSVRIDNGNSTTTCTDGIFGGGPELNYAVIVQGQAEVIYPQTGSCYTNPPFVQYNETFSCLSTYPASIQVCLQAFEDDGGGCVPAKSCLTQACQNFPTPAPGASAVYTLNVGGASSASINFTVTASGSFAGQGNDLICNAIDLGTLNIGSILGNGGLSIYDNFCATNIADPNPWGGTNDQGVWFEFTTGPSIGSTVEIAAVNDPQGLGDQINLQLALYESSNGACTGALTLIGEDYDIAFFDEQLFVNCLNPNTTYFILVDGEDAFPITGGQEGYFDLVLIDDGLFQAGDLICDAENLGAVSTGGFVFTAPLSQSNICASNIGDPTPSAWASDQTVWFQFQAPPSGSVSISADSDSPFGDAIDLQLALYGSTNNFCSGTLNEISSVYTPGSFDENFTVTCLTPGNNYWLMVDGSATNVDGVFDIEIGDAGFDPASNDEICNATALGTVPSGGTVGLNNQTNYCADNLFEPIPNNWGNDQGVWYTFIAPPSGVVEIRADNLTASSDQIDLQLAVYEYSSGCAGPGTELASEHEGVGVFFDEDLELECLTPGNTYYILVDGEGSLINPELQEGIFDIEVYGDPRDPPLGNNEVCNAIDLGNPTGGSVGTTPVPLHGSQNNYCADAVGEPIPSAFTPQQTVWYSFEAPATGGVNIQVLSDAILGGVDPIDISIAIYEANTCIGIFTEFFSDAAAPTYDINQDLICLTPNQRYYVQIDGTPPAILGGEFGYFDITISEIASPPPVTSTDTRFACSPFTWIDGNTYTSSNTTATFTLPSATGCDSIVTLNLTLPEPIYALNNTSSNIFCTDLFGWNHFYVNGDEIILSIFGDLSGADPGFPLVTVYDNGTFYQENQGPPSAAGCALGQDPGEQRFEMERSWDVDFGSSGVLNGTYEVRFYHEPAERAAIENAAIAWQATYPACGYTYKYPFPLGFYWFQNIGANYTAPDYEGILLSGTNGTASNGVNYAELTGITNFSGGSGAIILESNVVCVTDSTFAIDSSCNPADTGSVSVTNPNQFNCDSVHTIFTTLLPSDSTFEFLTSCNPIDTGSLSVINANQFNCDSVHTYVTTLLPSDSTFEFLTSCNPIDTGSFSVINANQFNCDSVHTYVTTLLPSDSTFEFLTSCNPIDTGSFSVINANQFNCDSVHTYVTTLLPSDSTFEFLTSCNPIDTGSFSVINANQFNCDSVHTYVTTLLPSDSTFEFLTSCNPIDTGSFSVINANQFNCDSVHTYVTTLLPSDSTFEFLTSCNPIDTGSFSVINANQFSCDSVHTVTTTLLPTSFAVENITACDSVLILGTWYSSSFSFNDTIAGGAANGCDSITSFNVTINFSDSTFATATSCNPADTGVVSVTNPNQANCDSVHTVTTTLLPSDSSFASATSCNPIDTGVVVTTNPNQFGCDSVHTVTTSLAPFSSNNLGVIACDSTTINGITFTTNTIYNDTIVGGASNGCDSITVYSIIINNSDSTFATATSCNPLDTGTVSVSNPNQFTCDSVHTVTTTLVATSFAVENITACDSVLVLGTWYSSSFSFNDTIAGGAANGCDSITSFNVTINFSDSTFATATSCNPADTGVVSVTNPNQANCDSVHTVTTTLLPSDSTFASATSCNPIDTGVVVTTNPNQFGCDSVHTVTTSLAPFSSNNLGVIACDSTTINGITFTTNTIYNDTIVGGASNGCDSITVYSIIINNSDSTFATATSCNPLDTGTVSVSNPNQFNCDSVHTVTTTLLPTSFATENIIACDSAFVAGSWLSSSSTFNDTILAGASNGCDSIVTYNLTINNSDSTFATATSCNTADTGVVTVTNPNQANCDSVHTVTTTLLPSDSTFASATSCNPIDTGVVVTTNPNQFGCDSVHTVTTSLALFSSNNLGVIACDSTTINGITFTTNTIYNDTIVGGASNGCDSITVYSIIINNSDSTFATATSCNPVDTGTVSVSNPNQFNCDSVHTVTTTLLPTRFATENIIACDSAFVAGSWLSSSSTFNDTILAGASNGCDSIVTYNLTINNSDSTFATATSCNPADTGVVTVTNPNQANCDSVHTVTTTLQPSDSTFATATSCNPADTGVVSVTNPNQFTCDSVYTLTTTLSSFSSVNLGVTACDSTTINGITFFTTTIYNDTLLGGAANGCDSITVYSIIINNSDSTFATVTSCNPLDTGTVSVTNPNQFNCDSVHTVTTTLLATSFAVENITACDSVLVLGTWYSSSFSFNDTIAGGASNGCDSITSYNLTINNSDSTFATATSCNPADTGVVSVTNPNQFNCDSVHTVTTTLLPSDSTFASATSCNPIDTGVVVTTNPNQFGCDSVHTVTTSLAPFSSNNLGVIACDSTTINGITFTTNTIYNDTLLGGAANGCDSITVYSIIINNSDSTFATATSCNPLDTGTVSVSNPNQFNCDSVHTVTTTLLATSFAVENITACDSALILGNWISSSVSFQDTILGGAANGCDSITSFNVTINFSDSTFATATSCNPIDTGVFVTTDTTIFGCDSVHTLTTLLLPTRFDTVDITACDSVLVLGIWITSSLSFEDTIFGGAANACDSITTFNLTVNSSDSTFTFATSCNPADTGVLSVTNPNQLGCDSVHTTTTTLLPSDSTFVALTSCNPADTGTLTDVSINQFGCDSVHTVATSLLLTSSSFNVIQACDEFTFNGSTYFGDTTLIDTLVGANTCDSIATTQISISNTSSTVVPLLICPNDLPFTLANGVEIDGSQNSYIDTLTNPALCDSIVNYDITYAPAYDISPDFIVANLGDSVSFVLNNTNPDVLFSYVGNNGANCESPCNDYILIPTQEINNYFFSIIDTSTGCQFSDTLVIESQLFSELNVPNIFTPNGDGANDIFRCYGENIQTYTLQIFDRWGSKMFESPQLDMGWDGIFLGQPAESGIYIAIIQATGLDGQKYSISQNIKLVR